jgi:hypothetical protein
MSGPWCQKSFVAKNLLGYEGKNPAAAKIYADNVITKIFYVITII